MIDDHIKTSDDKQADLLYQFCKYLISNSESLMLYHRIIYESESKTYNTTYNEDVLYLINYQQKHGSYPPKFQQLFNEWLLMRM